MWIVCRTWPEVEVELQLEYPTYQGHQSASIVRVLEEPPGFDLPMYEIEILCRV